MSLIADLTAAPTPTVLTSPAGQLTQHTPAPATRATTAGHRGQVSLIEMLENTLNIHQSILIHTGMDQWTFLNDIYSTYTRMQKH